MHNQQRRDWVRGRLERGKIESRFGIASTAVISTGIYCGLHPAITALMAICSTVAIPSRGGTMPTRSPAERREPATILATAAGVGASIGSPSLKCRLKNQSCNSAGSAGTTRRSALAVLTSAARCCGTFLSCRSTLSYNFAARSWSCTSDKPPSGCANPRFGHRATPVCDSHVMPSDKRRLTSARRRERRGAPTQLGRGNSTTCKTLSRPSR